MSKSALAAAGSVGLALFVIFSSSSAGPSGRADQTRPDLDRKVQAFLDARAGQWHDLNVSDADGRILYDLVVKNNYTRALEIGTSTGHSGVWIAWALSKTGGRLITIDIDAGRHREAVANFREAGLDAWIDARLADAHELVPALPGPFDFVFCDADKDWYENYFVAVLPKLTVGGCFAAHNVSPRMRGGGRGAAGFLDRVLSLPFMSTSFAEGSRSGISVSYKRAAK